MGFLSPGFLSPGFRHSGIAERELDTTTVEQKNTSFVAQWYGKRLVLTKFCTAEQKYN